MKWIKSRKLYESSEVSIVVSDILQPLKDEDIDIKVKFYTQENSQRTIFVNLLKVRLDYTIVIDHLNHLISYLEAENFNLIDIKIDYVSGSGQITRVDSVQDVKNFSQRIKQDPCIKVYSIFLKFLETLN